MNQVQKNVVIILAKKPIPGKTKTRVAKDTSDTFAYKLGLYSFEDLLHNLINSNYYDLIVGTDTLEDLEWFEHNYNIGGITIDIPIEANLSERMKFVFHHLITTYEYKKVILIPMDMPFLQTEEIISAFSRMDTSLYALGPETNGGVYLIGMNDKGYKKGIFDDIAWSTPHSFETLTNNFGRKNIYKLKLKDDLNTFQEILSNRDQIKLYCPKLFNFLLSEGYFVENSKSHFIDFDTLNMCIPTVSAIVERTNNQGETEILLQTRNKPITDPTYSGLYEIPSGIIERYEKASNTVIREVKEETGLNIIIHSDYNQPENEKKGVRNDLVSEILPFAISQQLMGGRSYLNIGYVCKLTDNNNQKLTENSQETKNPFWIGIDKLEQLVNEKSDEFFLICLPLLTKYIAIHKNGQRRTRNRPHNIN